MIHPDPGMRRDIVAIGGTSQWPATIFRGIDQWGERYGYVLIDPICGAIGAFSTGDGISTGGQARTPICKMPNVEHTEQSFPLLFLYRRELTDSGGAGKYRGGLSGVSCFVPHGTDQITHDTLASGCAIPTSLGMMGGYPSTTNGYTFLRGSDILDRFARARMPEDAGEIAGERVTLGLRQENFTQMPRDVYAVWWCGGGGFGDPMARDPALVEKDVEELAVSVESARAIYGVVVDPSTLRADLAATRALREEVRRARVARHGRPAARRDGDTLLAATDALVAKADARGRFMACATCGAWLGDLRENYKAGCIREEHPIERSNPLVGEPGRFIDDRVVFRQFFCPGCGRLVENEVAVEGEPLLHDIEMGGPDMAPQTPQRSEPSRETRDGPR